MNWRKILLEEDYSETADIGEETEHEIDNDISEWLELFGDSRRYLRSG